MPLGATGEWGRGQSCWSFATCANTRRPPKISQIRLSRTRTGPTVVRWKGPRGAALADQRRRPDALRKCEHAFVTSQGHAYSRFRRALLTKNLTLIDAAARELQHVALDEPCASWSSSPSTTTNATSAQPRASRRVDDALRILVVLAEHRDERYERAAARFAARVTSERRLSLAEARYVLALAEALPRSPDALALLLRPYVAE